MVMLSSCICGTLVSVCAMKSIPLGPVAQWGKDLTYYLTPFFCLVNWDMHYPGSVCRGGDLPLGRLLYIQYIYTMNFITIYTLIILNYRPISKHVNYYWCWKREKKCQHFVWSVLIATLKIRDFFKNNWTSFTVYMYVKYSARRQVRPSTCTTRVVHRPISVY